MKDNKKKLTNENLSVLLIFIMGLIITTCLFGEEKMLYFLLGGSLLYNNIVVSFSYMRKKLQNRYLLSLYRMVNIVLNILFIALFKMNQEGMLFAFVSFVCGYMLVQFIFVYKLLRRKVK